MSLSEVHFIVLVFRVISSSKDHQLRRYILSLSVGMRSCISLVEISENGTGLT